MSAYFVVCLNLACDVLDVPIHMCTPVWDSMVVDWVSRACSIVFMGCDTQTDIVILDMVDFDVILEMN